MASSSSGDRTFEVVPGPLTVVFRDGRRMQLEGMKQCEHGFHFEVSGSINGSIVLTPDMIATVKPREADAVVLTPELRAQIEKKNEQRAVAKAMAVANRPRPSFAPSLRGQQVAQGDAQEVAEEAKGTRRGQWAQQPHPRQVRR